MHANLVNKSVMLDTLPQDALGSMTVEQLAIQCNADLVQRSQVTELANNLEPVDWRIPLVNHLKDPSQTKDRKFRR